MESSSIKTIFNKYYLLDFSTLYQPGPGDYENKSNEISKEGNYFLSIYPSSKCRTFGKGSQKSLNLFGNHRPC